MMSCSADQGLGGLVNDDAGVSPTDLAPGGSNRLKLRHRCTDGSTGLTADLFS